MIVAITGHRPPKVGGYRIPNPVFREIYNQLESALIARGPELVLTGMALGVDQWAARICLTHGIPFDAIIPFRGFETRWPSHAQAEFQELCSRAAHVHYVVDTREYRAAYLYRRNAWMVDHSSLLIAVWNGSPGGTANTVEYARRRGKEVHEVPVPPDTWVMARQMERGATPAPTRTRMSDVQVDLSNVYLPLTPTAVENHARQMRDVQEHISGAMGQFIGRTMNAQTAQEIEARTQQILSEWSMRQQDMQRRQMEEMEFQQVFRPSADSLVQILGIDMARDESIPQEPKPAAKDVIAPENRFKPARIIDIDD